MDLAPDFNEFFGLLTEHRVDFVVVGASATLDGLAVPFIGRQEFLANKRAAGRAKDLADIEALEGDLL